MRPRRRRSTGRPGVCQRQPSRARAPAGSRERPTDRSCALAVDHGEASRGVRGIPATPRSRRARGRRHSGRPTADWGVGPGGGRPPPRSPSSARSGRRASPRSPPRTIRNGAGPNRASSRVSRAPRSTRSCRRSKPRRAATIATIRALDEAGWATPRDPRELRRPRRRRAAPPRDRPRRGPPDGPPRSDLTDESGGATVVPRNTAPIDAPSRRPYTHIPTKSLGYRGRSP